VALAWSFSDGSSTGTGSMSVAVQGAANLPPVAGDDAISVAENAASPNLRSILLGNDTDPESAALAVTAVTQGAKGSVLLDNRGTTDASDDILTYTADGAVLDVLAAGQTTTDTFTYTVTDPAGLTSTATVTVTITGTNDAPTSPGASFELVEGQSTSQYAVVFAEGITWSAARDAALALGGGWDLATVTSAAEDNLLISLLRTDLPSRSHFYLGAYIDGVTGAFTWVTGEPFVYTNWGTGQPSGGEDKLAYDYYFGNWGWNDAPDDLGAYGFSRGYVIERAGAGGTLTATDADAGDTLTFALVGTAPTGFTLDASGNWRVDAESYNSLAASQTQTLTVPYTVTDASGASSTASLVITITGTNDAPVATGATVAVLEDGVVSGALPATDPDTGDTLTFSSNVTALPGFTLDAAGNWSFDASGYDSLAAGETQTLTIPYTVTDASGLSSSASLVITITGTNDAPVSPGATASVLEDGTVSGTLTATDTDTGDTQSFALTGTAPAGFTLDAAGNWSLDAASYDSLAAGQTLTLTVPYTVTDAAGASSTANLVITVTGINDAPRSPGATASVLEDASVSGTLPASDPDTGDTLSFALTGTAPAGFTLDAAGNWSLDASSYDSLAAGQTLTLTVPYTVTDVAGAIRTTNLVITITGTNGAPVSPGATASVLEDATVSGTLSATDADEGDTLSFALLGTAPAGVTLDAAGNWSFDASSYDSLSAGQTLTLTVAYTVEDVQDFVAGSSPTPYTAKDPGGLSSTTASLVITITGTNDAALLGADSGSTVWGTPVAIDVLANDSDIDNALAVTAITQGTNGSVKILADGRVEYTPTPGFTGTDAFTYTVADGVTQSVTVTVARGDLVWTNASGDNNWNNPDNWNQGLTPTSIDTVVVPDAVGAPQLSGGTTLVALHLSDTLTISDGTLTLTGASTIESTGNLVLDGSTLDGSAVLQSSGTLTLRGGTVNLTLDNAGLLIAEGGGVVDQGTADFVNSGTIIVPPGQNLQIVAGQFINRGDVKGHGTIDVTASLFLNDGAVSPGSSPGILTVSGNYTQTGAGVLNIELAGPVAGTQYDQLIVSGTATLAGNLNLILLNGFVPGPNDGIQILSAGSIVGDFGSISGLPPGVTFSVTGGFGQSVPPVIPGTTVFSTTPVGVVYIGVVSLDPAIYGGAPEQTWIYQALAPPPEDYMVGDLEWQDMMEDIMAMIAGEDIALTDTGEITLTDATKGGAQPDASLEAQLRAIADQFTDEQQQILDQLRAAEELLTCP
jgi:VCBS repeat-containing protein